jgi:predicted small metal-binding protein
MAEPNEETGLLHDENSTLLDETAPLVSHERKESLLPEFIFTSIDNMAEVVQEITEHIEDIAHEVTTFEPLDVDALVAEHEAEREADGEALTPEEEEEEIEELIHPTDPMDPFDQREKLGVIPLAVMVFYSVSGGPFGCETSVRAGGKFYALLGFLVMPCIWSVQEALMTAELGTTFPEASGGVAWVEEAFGQNAGWMSGEKSRKSCVCVWFTGEVFRQFQLTGHCFRH